MSVGTVVVYVHGLWLNGWESLLLRRRLSRQLECEALSYRYSSAGVGVRENARALARFLARVPAATLHLVGHSMGGLVILELFGSGQPAGEHAAPAAALPPGRIVLLGAPVRGSRAARNLARLPFGRRILGRTAQELLLPERDRRWHGVRELGVIAGNVPLGFGRFMGPFASPSDGTVLVEETALAGAKQQLTVRTTHSGMVYSGLVARQVASFLRDGRFSTAADRPGIR
ncbi:MAG TPA: alpha/beta fold hydrolase [Steroidobacteraceae bacterium]|nr:alpha/beta fold hydrolase [Steroidobacteraceae bacterium]